jgi:hypothetical protein
MRAMDIDLPDEWFETPEAFMHKSYDEKVAMISELRKPFTIEMVLQEINRYADSEFRYTDRPTPPRSMTSSGGSGSASGQSARSRR